MRIDEASGPSATAGFLRRRSSMPMWMDLAWRVVLLFGLIALVLLFHWIGRDGLKDNFDDQISFIDVLYFTTVTVTTVGYGDIVPVTPEARLFESLFVTPIRLFVWLIFLGTAYNLFLRNILYRWRMARIQADLHNHIIVTGFGTSGQEAVHELLARGTDAREIVVIDGSDNFPTRYLVNDACVIGGKPNVYGSIFRFEGQASVFATKDGPCYRCMFPEPPPPGLVPSCAEGGVLGILPGVVGTLQATEAIKLILGVGESLVGRFLLFDALKLRFRELKVRKDPDCPVCGEHPTVTQLIDYEQFCGITQTATAAATSSTEDADEATVEELKTRLDRHESFLLLDVREPQEFEICRIPGSVLIPLGDLPSRLFELEGRDDMIVHCKSGVRSGKAVKLLREAGYSKARNLKGGILAWINRIDPTLPKY